MRDTTSRDPHPLYQVSSMISNFYLRFSKRVPMIVISNALADLIMLFMVFDLKIRYYLSLPSRGCSIDMEGVSLIFD